LAHFQEVEQWKVEYNITNEDIDLLMQQIKKNKGDLGSL
jgi:NACalpha-BTF3-like transcription factor